MIDPKLREDGPAINDRVLRQFAAIWLVFFGGLAILNGLFLDRTRAGIVLAVIALAAGLPGLIRPRSVDLLFRAALAVATPIGWVVSHVLLAIAYFGMIMPIGLFFRLTGRDALARRFDKNARSYWVERPESTDPKGYLSQS